MRIGVAKLFGQLNSPDEWASFVKKRGYRAVVAPVTEEADDETVAAYRKAASDNDLVIAEVGIWRNTCSDDEPTRKANIAVAKAKLHLADRIGARCAVNIVGERTRRGAADDLTQDAFDRAVEVVREIIDDVGPVDAYYCLETMPYMLPDSVDAYVKMVAAVDRDHFGVHCDPANFMNSPRNYHNNAAMIKDFFRRLGPQIRSCHAKDVLLDSTLLVRFHEVMPGTGGLCYPSYIREINRLDPEMPLIIEHLKTDQEYRQAADYLRSVEGEAMADVGRTDNA